MSRDPNPICSDETRDRLIDLLYAQGLELPGDRKDWMCGRPLRKGQKRNQYDIEEGMLAWFFYYEGPSENQEASNWSEFIGGNKRPESFLKGFTLKTNKHKYRDVSLEMEQLIEEEGEQVAPTSRPRQTRVIIYKCEKCGQEWHPARKFRQPQLHKADHGRLILVKDELEKV